jgi:hypothetical protein
VKSYQVRIAVFPNSVADHLHSKADSILGIFLIESAKFLTRLTRSGAIFDSSDASAARKLQGSDDRKWRLPTPEEPPKSPKKAMLPWLL